LCIEQSGPDVVIELGDEDFDLPAISVPADARAVPGSIAVVSRRAAA